MTLRSAKNSYAINAYNFYFSEMKAMSNSIIILLVSTIHALAQQPIDQLIAAEKNLPTLPRSKRLKKLSWLMLTAPVLVLIKANN